MLNHTSKLVKSLLTSFPGLFGPRRRANLRRRHLELDVLEDRTVPSQIFKVTSLQDGTGPGTLRSAIIAANKDMTGGVDIIQIALPNNQQPYKLNLKNTPQGQDNIAQYGDLDIFNTAHSLVIQGLVQGNAMPIIDASEMNDRVFQVMKGVNVEFQNLIIKGGVANDDGSPNALPGKTTAWGGAILNDGGIIKLTNVSLIGNSARGRDGQSFLDVNPGVNGTDAEGGGIYSRNGKVTLVGVTAKNNFAQGGNGGVGGNASELDANGNFGIGGGGGQGGHGEGGALFATNTSVDITGNSVFQGNLAAGGFGGKGGDGTFGQGGGGSGGVGGFAAGGALYVFGGGSFGLEQTRITDNSALGGLAGVGGDGPAGGDGAMGGSAEGGGIYFDTTMGLTNVLLQNNSATGRAGGNGGNATPVVLPDDADDDDAGGVFAEGGTAGKGGRGGDGGNALGGALACTDTSSILGLWTTAITFNSAVAGAGGIGGKGGDVGNSFYNGSGGDGGTGGHVKGGGLFTLGNALEFTSSPFTHNTASAGAGGAGGNGGNGGGHGGAAYDTFNHGGKGGIGGDAQGGGIWTSHAYLETDAAIDINVAVAGKGGNGGNGGPGDYVGGFASDGGVGGIAQGGGLYAEFGSCNFYDSTVSSNTATGGDGGDGGDAGPTADFNYPSMASANGAMAGTAEGGGIFALQETVYMIREQVNGNIAAGGKSGAGGDGPAGPTDFIVTLQIGGSGGDGGSGGHGGLGQGGGIWAVGDVSVSVSTFDSNNAFGGFGGQGGHGGASGPGPDGALPAGNGGSAGHGGGAQGGGLYLSGANFDTSACTFSHNGLAPGRGGLGGAGGNSQADPASNFGAGGVGGQGGNGGVGQGAGMFDDDTESLMDNVTFSSNYVLDSFGGPGGAGGAGVDPGQNGPGGATGLRGDVWGGGILLTKGHLGLGNVTIAFNTLFGPTAQGGGVFCLSAKDIQFGTVDAFDTLIAKNTAVVAPDFLGHFSPISTKILLGVNDGSNLPFDGVLVGSQVKGPVEPRLGPLQYNGGPNQVKTHALLTATGFSPASPAINAGDNQFASGENDERGLPRIVGKSVDIGAFELQASFIVQPENHNHGQPGGTHPAKIIDRVFSLLIPGHQFLTTELAAHRMEFGLPGFLIRPADRLTLDVAPSGIWRGFLASAADSSPPKQTNRQQESHRRDEAIWFEGADFGMASLPWLFNAWAG